MMVSLPANAQECNLHFSGHVEDRDTREQLSFATVRIVELDNVKVTDASGNFTFSNLCRGRYTIKITHFHCDTLIKVIELVNDDHIDFHLPHSYNVLGEVVVAASAQDNTNSGLKRQLKGAELQQARGNSLGEALSKLNGVTVLQTGTNIAKPIIHGMHGNRILTINNGVRQEGQQWGNEHAPDIDPFIADNLVVVKGVDELKYGSDAIAGVVLVNPKPLRRNPGYLAEMNTGYSTNNRLIYASAAWEQQPARWKGFSYKVHGTIRKAANSTTANYRLNNTGFNELNVSAAASWRKKKWDIDIYYSRFASTIAIFPGAHVGNISDLLQAIKSERPDNVFLGEDNYTIARPYQKIAHHLAKATATTTIKGQKLSASVAAQYNERSEYDYRRGNQPGAEMQLHLLTLSQDISWTHSIFKRLTGTAGIAASQQDNVVAGRYLIPNYKSYSFGGYWIEKWNKNRWQIDGGLRIDYRSIETLRLPFNQPPIEYNFNNTTFAASLNTTYKASKQLNLIGNIAFSSRAPYVNELLSDGIHHGTGTFETGLFANAAFTGKTKPEKALHTSFGFDYNSNNDMVHVTLSLYNNYIEDFIYQQPMPDSPVLTVSGAFPRIGFAQTTVLISGLDLALSFHASTAWQLSAKASLVRGYNIDKKDWLILMPADRMTIAATYKFANVRGLSNGYLSIEAPLIARQSRLPDETRHGRQDYKVPPAGYALVNILASTTISSPVTPITITAGINNLFNLSYRDYLNQFRYFTDEVGRNFSLKISLSLQKH